MKTKKNRPSLPELLNALAPVVRPTMLEYFPSDCCIATCAILARAFRVFGYKAHPLAVSVSIYNSNRARMLKHGSWMPSDMQDKIAFFDREKAWGVAIAPISIDSLGRPSRGPKFEGHVALRVEQTLVDAALKQADRIDRNIVLPMLFSFDPGQDFFVGENHPEYELTANDCLVVYKRFIDHSYQRSNDWKFVGPPCSTVLNKIILSVEERISDEVHVTAQ